MAAILGTIFVGLLLCGVVALILRKLWKDKKQGKSLCGCDCKTCGGSCHGNCTTCQEDCETTTK